MSQTPVHLLTGFLGSGKTTLLSRALSSGRLPDTAVIINEFGEIGLDHDLLESGEETVVEAFGGCLCCTIRSDLHDTLLDLADRRATGSIAPFRRVIVESTGLADPAPIIHTLLADPALGGRYRLGLIATTVDAVNGDASLDRYEEAVKQVAVADRVIVTKTDLVADPASVADLAALRARLRGLNRTADLLDTTADPDASVEALADIDPRSAMNVDALRRWIGAEPFDRLDVEASHENRAHHHDHDINRHGDDIRAHCIAFDRPVDPAAFRLGLELLASCCGEDLLRIKGILYVAGKRPGPILVQGAQHVLGPPIRLPDWPSGDHRSRLVVIVRGIPKAWVDRLFASLGLETV